MNSNNNSYKNQIIHYVFKNKALAKYIFSKIRFIHVRLLWSQLPQHYNTFELPKRYHQFTDANYILKRGYIGLLKDRVKLIHLYNNTNYSLSWTGDAYLLVGKLIKDEETLSLLVDYLKDHRFALLEAALKTNNITLCKLADSKIVSRLIAGNDLHHIFTQALKSGSGDCVEYLLSKYMTYLFDHRNSMQLAVQSGDGKSVRAIINSMNHYSAPSGSMLVEILKIGYVDALQDMFTKSDTPSVDEIVDAAQREYTQMEHTKFTWNHLECLVFTIKLISIPVDIDILHRSNNPYQLNSDTQLPFYIMFKLLQSINSKYSHSNQIYQSLVSINNIGLIDYLLSLKQFSSYVHTSYLFTTLVAHGTIETVKRYANYQQSQHVITSISKIDSVQILSFIRNQVGKSITFHNDVFSTVIKSEQIDTIFYMLEHMFTIDLETFQYWEFKENVRIALAEHFGIILLRRMYSNEIALHFMRIYHSFGDNFMVGFLSDFTKRKVVEYLVQMRLKEEFEIAVKNWNILLDPIHFLRIGDIDWLKQVISKNLCSKITNSTESNLNYLGYYNILKSDSTLNI